MLVMLRCISRKCSTVLIVAETKCASQITTTTSAFLVRVTILADQATVISWSPSSAHRHTAAVGTSSRVSHNLVALDAVVNRPLCLAIRTSSRCWHGGRLC